MDHVHRSACPSQDVEEASEITLGRSRCVHASCKIVSGVYRRSGYFFTNYHLFVLHANNLRYIVLQVCNPSDSGEYRINCISLLILSILQVTGLTYLKKCQALVEEGRRDVAVADIKSHLFPHATMYPPMYSSNRGNYVLFQVRPQR